MEDLSRYIYLLSSPPEGAIGAPGGQTGWIALALIDAGLFWADSFDEVSGRYRGLRSWQDVNISKDNLSRLLVKPAVAIIQMDAEKADWQGVAFYVFSRLRIVF